MVCLVSLLSLSVLALAPSAGAQGYPGSGGGSGYPGSGGGGSYPGSYGGPTYSGGTVVLTHAGLPTTTTNYSNNNDGTYGGGYYCGAGSGPSGTPDSASVYCSGAITATFNWNNSGNPNNLPPKCVIITEHCTVTWSGQMSGGASVNGGCTNPLGGSSVPATPGPGATWDCTRYTVQNDPPATLTLSCDAEADAEAASGSVPNASSTGSATVKYSASVSPVTLDLAGTTPDSNGNLNILVGQGCPAKLVGIPSDLLNNTAHPPTYSWTISGTTFQGWNGNSGRLPVAAELGPGPLTNPLAHWYWNDLAQTPETITCTATLTPPSGSGTPFNVTLTQQVTVQVPTLTAFGTASYMQVNTKAPKDPEYELWGSMDWSATFHTPTSPAFGQGTIEIVQITTPYQSDTTNTTPPQSEQGAHYGVPFMDFGCPYNSHLCTEAAQPYADSDNPGQQLTVRGQIYAISASDSSVYTDFIMYSPPGTDTQWVPLASFNWNTNGKANLPNSGQWSGYVAQHGSDAAEAIDSTAKTITPSTTTPFSPGNTFPHWMQAF